MFISTLVPVLVVQSGPLSGKSFRVQNTLRIGRHPSNEVSLEDASVSRRHASIEVTDEGVYVSDHGSANGTFVNGKRVADRLLVLSGDTIRVGHMEFVFKDV